MSNIKIFGNGKKMPVLQRTTDYSIFRRMEGNREVTAQRAGVIKQSIEKIGLIPSPLIVNEFMEIIDGQGRFEAIKQLELPVFYIVVPGLGLQDCVSMNVNSTPWKTIDYIRSYAETGNDNYVRLVKLIDSYVPNLPFSVVICAATGLMTGASSSVKLGELNLPEEHYKSIDEMLSYVSRFTSILKQYGKSNQSPVLNALCFCYQCEAVDNERMFHAFESYAHKLNGSSKIVEVLDSVTEIYNFGRKKNKVYIKTKYLEYLDGKYPWYAEKWGHQLRIGDAK